MGILDVFVITRFPDDPDGGIPIKNNRVHFENLIIDKVLEDPNVIHSWNKNTKAKRKNSTNSTETCETSALCDEIVIDPVNDYDGSSIRGDLSAVTVEDFDELISGPSSEHEEDDGNFLDDCTELFQALSVKQDVETTRTKSILKPHYPVLVPISNQRGYWKSLPPLDLEKIHDMSNQSGEEWEARLQRWQEKRRVNAGSRRRRVCFGDIHIRSFSQTVGDNPSVRSGAPITLDWKYQQRNPIAIDEYERCRGKFRRSLSQMIMDPGTRKKLLVSTYGVSKRKIEIAERLARQDQVKRTATLCLLPFCKVEEVYQSASRKYQRRLKTAN